MPRITLTPVQPRAVFPRDVISSDEKVSTGEEGEEEEDGSQSDNHPDLGRLYFSLRYDEHRSMLMVRLIRAEDIPVEDQSLSTYVDVYLLPQDLQSETFQPHDATINVSFRFVL
ncbi:PREDICTED: synaptotagmin-10-like [Acropora digitifera]|uniref:synaptotagmin-10-like n=1 Tax=Acropora digitifera TaxID=70779 RepID=UPI00077B0816|nr:PREDICTED: synaptotagmin-10-like [Acropora digitifera]